MSGITEAIVEKDIPKTTLFSKEYLQNGAMDAYDVYNTAFPHNSHFEKYIELWGEVWKLFPTQVTLCMAEGQWNGIDFLKAEDLLFAGIENVNVRIPIQRCKAMLMDIYNTEQITVGKSSNGTSNTVPVTAKAVLLQDGKSSSGASNITATASKPALGHIIQGVPVGFSHTVDPTIKKAMDEFHAMRKRPLTDQSCESPDAKKRCTETDAGQKMFDTLRRASEMKIQKNNAANLARANARRAANQQKAEARKVAKQQATAAARLAKAEARKVAKQQAAAAVKLAKAKARKVAIQQAADAAQLAKAAAAAKCAQQALINLDVATCDLKMLQKTAKKLAEQAKTEPELERAATDAQSEVVEARANVKQKRNAVRQASITANRLANAIAVKQAKAAFAVLTVATVEITAVEALLSLAPK